MGARVLVNRWSRRASTLTLSLVVVAAAAACGASSPAPSASPPSSAATSRAPSSAPPTAPATATPTTTAAPPDDETQVRAVIDKYWEEWTRAIREANPESSELLGTIDGAARDRVVADLRKSSQLGQISLRSAPGPVPHRTLTVSVSGDEAMITECAIDDTVLVEQSTSSTLNTLVQSLLITTMLSKRTGAWMIVQSQVSESREGTSACPGV